MDKQESKRYYKYSDYLKKAYGERVYKLPINLPVTCPNRDGNISYGGCTYCGSEGAGFEVLSDDISIKKQLKENMDYIGNKYKAKKFIAYFQNYTNTYMKIEDFKKAINESCINNIVEIAISTRPDCISLEQLEFLKNIKDEKGINITIELGIQTVNYHSLYKVNRGHTLAEFINAVLNIKKYDFIVCAHIILNLPWDNMEDVIENAKIMSVLKVEQVKIHSLYLIKGTSMADEYLKGEFNIISVNEYIERAIIFLEYLSQDISIQRLLGRAPKERSVFANWDMSWWKIRDMIEKEMDIRNTFQGAKTNYLNNKSPY